MLLWKEETKVWMETSKWRPLARRANRHLFFFKILVNQSYIIKSNQIATFLSKLFPTNLISSLFHVFCQILFGGFFSVKGGGAGGAQIGQKWSANKNFREFWQRIKRLAQTISPFLRTMLENSNIMSFATVLITFSDLSQTPSSPLRPLQLLEGSI